MEIVAISETKLTEEKNNRNFNSDGYNFIHCDSVTRASGVGFTSEIPWHMKYTKVTRLI